MRLVIAFFLLAVLHGCMPNASLTASAAADMNVGNLSRLTIGMNQKEVLRIMRHPYSDQTFEMDGAMFDVWFYITDIVCLGQSRMVPGNLTPLTFKNGELVGWGYAYYNYLKNRKIEAEHPRIYKPPAPEKVEPPAENIELEKTLKELVPSIDQIQQRPQGQKNSQMTPTPSSSQPKPTPQRQGKTPAEQPENLSPLEPQPPQQPANGAASIEPQSSSFSISSKQRFQNEENASETKQDEAKKAPMNEEDEEMLQDASQQQFDQT